MRSVIVPQMKLVDLAIADIELDPKSRDNIPQILRELQHVYTTPELREPIFTILEEVLPERQIEGKVHFPTDINLLAHIWSTVERLRPEFNRNF